MGKSPINGRRPTANPDVAAAWTSLLLPRWGRAANFGNGWEWSTDHTIGDMRALIGNAPMSQWAQVVSDLMTSGTMPRREIKRIQAYIDTFSNPTDQIVGEAFELVASSPGFGRY